MHESARLDSGVPRHLAIPGAPRSISRGNATRPSGPGLAVSNRVTLPMIDADVFSGGPPRRLQQSLGLITPAAPHVGRRAVIAALAAWGPLALLAVIQSLASPGHSAGSFFSDFATHTRSLVAIPALILAEPDCMPWLRRIVRTFVAEGLVVGADLERFQSRLASARRLLDSQVAEVATILIAYAIVVPLIVYVPAEELSVWHRRSAGTADLTIAGWWHALVSLPILLVLFLGWLWRLVVWTWFLACVARLDLQLIASHPDHAGGLRFVSTSLQGFRLVSIAMGAVLAGAIANRMIHHGVSPFAFRRVVLSLLISSAILFAGPLTVFIRRLRLAKRHGIFEYGALASGVGKAFEARWLRQAVTDHALSAEDFSAMTDLDSIVANVHDMRSLPFRLTDLAGPVGGAALPLVPVAFLALPVQEIVDTLAKLLL